MNALLTILCGALLVCCGSGSSGGAGGVLDGGTGAGQGGAGETLHDPVSTEDITTAHALVRQ